MEIQKLYDFDELDLDDIAISLVRLVKHIPDYELFFQINQSNNEYLNFSRIKDLVIEGQYFDYYFTRFQGYHKFSKTCFTLIANKSVHSVQKQEITELFTTEENVKHLLNNQTDVDYLVHSSEEYPDFSVILWPSNLVFPLQEYRLCFEEELYQIIQYYE